MTLQVKSVEHLQTWIKKSDSIQSELLIQPLDLSFDILENSMNPETNVINTLWWTGDNKALVLDSEQQQSSAKLNENLFKRDQKNTQNEIL